MTIPSNSPPAIYTREDKLPKARNYSVFRKFSMAITGLTMLVFLYGHFIGNSVLLSGETAFSAYYQWLQNHHFIHYSVWLIISLMVMLHIWVAFYHYFYNRKMRPVAYHQKSYQITTWGARSMFISGLILLLFIIFHVAQMRGWLNFSHIASVYHNLIESFNHWQVVLFYLLAQLALAMHLYHGLWSQFQTLGISHPDYNHFRRPFALIIGVGIALLNALLIFLITPLGQQLIEVIK